MEICYTSVVCPRGKLTGGLNANACDATCGQRIATRVLIRRSYVCISIDGMTTCQHDDNMTNVTNTGHAGGGRERGHQERTEIPPHGRSCAHGRPGHRQTGNYSSSPAGPAADAAVQLLCRCAVLCCCWSAGLCLLLCCAAVGLLGCACCCAVLLSVCWAVLLLVCRAVLLLVCWAVLLLSWSWCARPCRCTAVMTNCCAVLSCCGVRSLLWSAAVSCTALRAGWLQRSNWCTRTASLLYCCAAVLLRCCSAILTQRCSAPIV